MVTQSCSPSSAPCSNLTSKRRVQNDHADDVLFPLGDEDIYRASDRTSTQAVFYELIDRDLQFSIVVPPMVSQLDLDSRDDLVGGER
jgi:hypothetical protein